jgi:signal transduction histidine kinase
MIPKYVFNYYVVPGYGYFIFTSYFILIALFGLILLYFNYKKFRGIRAYQIKYLLLASATGFVGGGSVFALSYNISFPPYLLILFTTFPLMIAYAVTRYHLMDIKYILKRSTVFTFLVAVITALYVSSSYFLTLIFENFFGSSSKIVSGLIIGILIAIIFEPLKNFLQSQTDRFLFSKEYNPKILIGEITGISTETLELKKILNNLSAKLSEAFHPTKICFFLLNGKGALTVANQSGFDAKTINAFTKGKEKFLPDYFKSSKDIIIISELTLQAEKGEYSPRNPQLLKDLNEIGLEILLPLFVKNKLIGVFSLGEKKNNDPYSSEDLSTLEIIARQIAIALENASLYDQVMDFNVHLQERVDEQTKEIKTKNMELESANAKLKELDKAKSDFIDMASHQLRTPLTAVRGWTSMLLQGDFGPLNEKQTNALNIVAMASDQQNNLVEDLLNAARIEAGRIEYTYEETDLSEIVDGVVKQLQPLAMTKKISLSFIKPKKKLPLVKIDRTKIRQIVINFVENAVKYTSEGFVQASLEQVDNKLRFCVTDTGMGISKADFKNLFQKFGRGSNNQARAKGTGVGLYTAKIMLGAHPGGRIWAESEGEGKGSKFCFEVAI